MKPHELEDLFESFTQRIKAALIAEPGDPPTGRKVMQVGVLGSKRPVGDGRAQVLSFVTLIMGSNHGFRIERYGDTDYAIRGWDHSASTSVGQIMIRITGDVTNSHLELIARTVALPFSEEEE